MKHKSPDYKLSAVNYYLNHDVGYDNTCKIFDCKKSSLKRWIHKYKTSKNLTIKNFTGFSYVVFIFQIIFYGRNFIILTFMRHSYNKNRKNLLIICPILNLQGCKILI